MKKNNPFIAALRDLRLRDLRLDTLQAKLVVAAMAMPEFMQAIDANAQGTGQPLPWVQPICIVANSLSGDVARGIAIIVLVVTGLLLAFGETGGIFKTAIGVLFGLSFALLSTQMIQAVFPKANWSQCPTN